MYRNTHTKKNTHTHTHTHHRTHTHTHIIEHTHEHTHTHTHHRTHTHTHLRDMIRYSRCRTGMIGCVFLQALGVTWINLGRCLTLNLGGLQRLMYGVAVCAVT